MIEKQKSNPLIEKQLQALADICCNEIQADDQTPEQGEQEERIRPLIDALVTNGFARLSREPLSLRVEALVEEQCPEAVLSRRGRLTAMTGRMQEQFESAVRMETSTPPEADHTLDDEVTTGAR